MSADLQSNQADTAFATPARRPGMSAPERGLVVIVVLTLAIACLAISAKSRVEDGQRPWPSGSLLQPLTQWLNLNEEYPTTKGTEVKLLALGLGVAAALVVAVATWFAATKLRDPLARPAGVRPPRSLRDRLRLFFVTAAPTSAAQMALVLYAAWAFLSAAWSAWPGGTLGEAFLQMVPIVWAIVLGRALRARGARTAAMGLAGVLALTAALGVWYYYVRNPGQRLKFPIGNPIFLSACLIPSVLLCLAWLTGSAVGAIRALIGQQEATAPAAPASGAATDSAGASRRRVVLVILGIVGCGLGLSATIWAILLADSRGPQAGLAAGVAVAAFLAVPRLVRWIMVAGLRMAADARAVKVIYQLTRWSLVVVAGAGALAFALRIASHLEDEGSRWATMRFRTYVWRYAVDRMAVRPVTGTGQGGFFLGSQAMHVLQGDVERDPAAFPGWLIAHAHNEWLEVLSDLGAAGFALIATALGVTLWGAALALRKTTCALDWWTLLGLIGALGALIVEELSNSTMRTDVFPLIFYTVVGLIWALTATTEKPPVAETEPGHSAGVRRAGLLLGIVGSVLIAWFHLSDWQGARAESRANDCADQKDWEGALSQAASAERMRLGMDGRLRAEDTAGIVTQLAAGYWYGELRNLYVRTQQSPEGLTPPKLQVAAELGAKFAFWSDLARQADETVLARMPYYVHTAARLGSLFLLKTDEERLEAVFGLRANATDYTDKARLWFKHEYERDPFNPDAALRLLAVTPSSEPIAERLNLLRQPLRGGPVRSAVTQELAEFMKESGFAAAFEEWMSAARASMRGDPSGPWTDSYAPETLRLAALRCEVERAAIPTEGSGPGFWNQSARALMLAREAEQWCGAAATMLVTVRAHFPTPAAYARAEQAKFHLWATPNDPEPALALYRQALSEWPADGPKDQYTSMRASLSVYLLAAGRLDEARTQLRQVFPEDPPAITDARAALCLGEFCRWFINVPAPARPANFEQQVARLSELDPTWPNGYLMAAQLALEHGDDAAALAHLQNLRQRCPWENYVQAVRFLMKQFPDNDAVRLLGWRRTGAQPDTNPA